MKTTINKSIWNLLFNLYLWLSKSGYYRSRKNNVYDHLGIIDTLGYQSDTTTFTASYSEELYSMYFIKLPFGYALKLSHDASEYDIRIGKFLKY